MVPAVVMTVMPLCSSEVLVNRSSSNCASISAPYDEPADSESFRVSRADI